MIAIVGAGLAGLTAARELEASGFTDFMVYDKSSVVGGRVRTEAKDGFLIDRGFQVLNPEYRILENYIPVHNLELGFFESGSILLSEHSKPFVFRDPIETPVSIFSQLTSSQRFAFRDLLAAGILRFKTQGFAEEPSESTSNTSTLKEFFESGYFSADFLDRFLKPFFAGVLLSREFDVPFSYFEYLFGLFGRSNVGLPKRGMGHLAELLAEPLPDHKIQLNANVKSVADRTLNFEDADSKKFDAIIVATDTTHGKQLLGNSFPAEASQRSILTLYFSTPVPPWQQNLLGLVDWNSECLVNHISVQTHAQPNYSSSNESLLSVNLMRSNSQQLTDSELETQVKESLKPLKIKALDSWKLVARTQVDHALPAKFSSGEVIHDQPGVFFAGDYLETPSIGGAMLSGKKAALRAIKRLTR
ncbi:MAG: FAD-dependent oxidoreductase [Bdellovibrionales bacterium]|nr:FAD-dependent oxidoreductase [Bdellovibrionales bacterium]